jgi:hypothetical protein
VEGSGVTTWVPDKKRPAAMLHLMDGKKQIATVYDRGGMWVAQVLVDRAAKFSAWHEIEERFATAEAAKAACDRALGVRR